MNNRDASFLLIPLVAAIMLYLPLSSGAHLPEANPPSAAVSAKVESSGQVKPPPFDDKGWQSNAATLIAQFLGIDRQTGQKPDREMACTSNGVTTSQYKLEFMIATLPDPLDSRLNYMFDRNLDAIQRAIESADFVLDRFDFPWREDKSRAGDKGDPAGDQKREAEPVHRLKPGVILYRSRKLGIKSRCPLEIEPRYPGRLLVLFIVGETPTAGVHKEALKNALDQIKLLSRWDGKGGDDFKRLTCLPAPAEDHCPSPVADRCEVNQAGNPSGREIRIMGPTFSGSADSLELALQNWREESFDKHRQPIFSVISGSATSISQCQFCERLNVPGQPQFHSTVIPSQHAVEEFIRYLVDLDPQAANGKIAILKETTTVYGQSSIKKPVPADGKIAIPKETTSVDGQSSSKRPAQCEDQHNNQIESNVQVMDLPYPLHISQLRSESEKAKSSRSGLSPDLRNVRRPLLPLLMDEGRETIDVVPLYSRLEPASLELALSTLLNEINRERIRYVGIISTDVRDCIFLVGEIRRHCPNAVIFTFFADLLYLRPEVNVDLLGTMVITPYPLFGPNQFWSYPFLGRKTRLHFPTQVTQGAYNATLALLGQPQLLEYGNPFENAQEVKVRKPILWISTVGRNSFMPVKILNYQKQFKNMDDPYPLALSIEKKGDQNPPEVPTLSLAGALSSKISIAIVLVLITFGLVIPITIFVQLVRSKKERFIDDVPPFKQISRSQVSEIFGDPLFDKYKFRRRFYLLLCCTSLLFIYMQVMWVLLLPRWVQTKLTYLKTGDERAFLLIVVLIGLAMILSLVSAVWLWGSIAGWVYVICRDRAISLISRFRTSASQNEVEKNQREEPNRFLVRLVGLLTPALTLAATFYIGFLFLTARSVETHVFFFVRATDLTSGVSPLLPILLVGAASFLCAFCSLRRWGLVERIHIPHENGLPSTSSFLNFESDDKDVSGEKRTSCRGVTEMERRVIRLLRCSSLELPASPLIWLLVLIAFWYVFVYRFIPTGEGAGFDLLFRAAFGGVSIGLALAFLRFVSVWRELRHLLLRLSSHPLFSGANEQTKERLRDLPKIKLTSPAANYTPTVHSVHDAIRLCQSLQSARNTGKDSRQPASLVHQPNGAVVDLVEAQASVEQSTDDLAQRVSMTKRLLNDLTSAQARASQEEDELHQLVNRAEKELNYLLDAKAKHNWRKALEQRCVTQVLLAAISKKVAAMLEPRWSMTASGWQSTPQQNSECLKSAETYLSGRVVAFLHYVLAHLQNLVVFVTAGMLLLLLSITSYPFNPRDLILLFGWLLILTVAASTLLIFVQMNRDKMLSLLSGTNPGELNLNKDFVFRVLIHGLVPILALLSAQFPEVIQQIFSWFRYIQGGGN
jgi:hypothetical protein